MCGKHPPRVTASPIEWNYSPCSRASSHRTASAIENGERKPTLETLYRMSGALGVSMWVIVKEMEEQLERREKQEKIRGKAFFLRPHKLTESGPPPVL